MIEKADFDRIMGQTTFMEDIILKEKMVWLLILAALCYIAAFLKLPIIFVMLFFAMSCSILFFIAEKIFWLTLSKTTHDKYRTCKTRYNLIIICLLIILVLARKLINECYMGEDSTIRMTTKYLMLMAIFAMVRSFLISGFAKKNRIVFCNILLNHLISCN